MSIDVDPLRPVRGMSLEDYRAGMGEYLGAVASDAWASGPLASGVRLVQAGIADETARERGERLMAPEEASDQGRDLGLRFEAPISQGAFDVLAGEKRRQLADETIFKRARAENGYGTMKWLLGGGAEFLTMAADPLNIAAAFVPVVGEARYAMMAARFGRLPATLLKGAAEGAAGQLLLEPLTALDRHQQGDEYGLLDTLLNVSFGAGLGVALHGAAYGAGAGFRFVRDRYVSRAPDPSAELRAGAATPTLPSRALDEAAVSDRTVPHFEKVAEAPPRQPVAEAMEQLRPETKTAALRTAIAQLAQDKPVDIEPVLRADPQWVDVKATIEGLQAHERLQAGTVGELKALLPGLTAPADYRPAPEQLRMAQRLARGLEPEKPLKEPLSLTEFVIARGGIPRGMAEAAELEATDLDKKLLKQLIAPERTAGNDPQQHAIAARESGFRLGEDTREGSGVDLKGFMDALLEDAGGRRKHHMEDHVTEAWQAQQQFFHAIDAQLRELGLDLRGRSPRDIAHLLEQEPHTQRLMALAEQIDRLDEHSSLEVLAELDRQRADLEQAVLREPGLDIEDTAIDHRERAAPTAQELERYYAEFERAAGPGEAGRQAAGERQPAAGRPGEGGEAAAAGPAGRDPAAEAARLRREGGEGTEGPAGRPAELAPAADELAAFAERQRSADLHADQPALAARDERLAQTAREADQLLQEDLKDFAHLVDEETRGLLDETARIFDEEATAMDALAACRIGGGA